VIAIHNPLSRTDLDALARALILTGDRRTRSIAREALNGYRYQRLKIARAVAMVQAFRALREGATT
jgi:hypothetical protein